MRILVTGAWSGGRRALADMKNMGHEVVFMQNEKDELPCAYDWLEGIICNGLFLHHDIEKFTSLKYIQLTSAGYDRVPMKYIKEHNIEIHNAKGVYSVPMAEFAVGGVLQLYKQSQLFYENQKQRKWEKHRGLLELYGKTVLILGCGSVGTECAERFSAFGCEVIGIDVQPREDECYKVILPLSELDEALSEADILILTLPLTEETRHLIDENRLSLMKPGAVLLNISRGAVVDEKALIEALQTNLGGAALDVFEEEPLKEDSPLWNMENVIVTPHNSFVGSGNEERLNTLILKNVKEGAV